MQKYLIPVGLAWVGLTLLFGLVMVFSSQNHEIGQLRKIGGFNKTKVIMQQEPKLNKEGKDAVQLMVNLPETVGTEAKIIN